MLFSDYKDSKQLESNYAWPAKYIFLAADRRRLTAFWQLSETKLFVGRGRRIGRTGMGLMLLRAQLGNDSMRRLLISVLLALAAKYLIARKTWILGANQSTIGAHSKFIPTSATNRQTLRQTQICTLHSVTTDIIERMAKHGQAKKWIGMDRMVHYLQLIYNVKLPF